MPRCSVPFRLKTGPLRHHATGQFTLQHVRAGAMVAFQPIPAGRAAGNLATKPGSVQHVGWPSWPISLQRTKGSWQVGLRGDLELERVRELSSALARVMQTEGVAGDLPPLQ